MPSISDGMNRRGHKALMEARYSDAVLCFFRAHIAEPDNENMLSDLIYALNQNGDYITALEYCYAYIGMHRVDGMLLFSLAEALGGLGSVSGCAAMLRKSLEISPDGAASEDARSFLEELIHDYGVDENEVELSGEYGVSGLEPEAAFANQESFEFSQIIDRLYERKDYNGIRNAVEREISNGNFSLTVLTAGICYSVDTGDKEYLSKTIERFDYAEDYTLLEINTLAGNLDVIGDDNIAYEVYRRLYSQESGERDIAYGFAVACAKCGMANQAQKLIDDVIASCRGIGGAARYRNRLEAARYFYGACYEESDLTKMLGERVTAVNAPEVFDYIRFGVFESIKLVFDKLDLNDIIVEEELRRLTVSSGVNIILRAMAAKLLYDAKKPGVYINTGCDIVEYHPALYGLIDKMLKGVGNNEGID